MLIGKRYNNKTHHLVLQHLNSNWLHLETPGVAFNEACFDHNHHFMEYKHGMYDKNNRFKDKWDIILHCT